MRPLALLLLFISLIVTAVIEAEVPADTDLSEPAGFRDAPEVLCRVWLRFHETDLCQGMDAVFVFNRNGMEAWIRIEDKKSYEKLQRLLEPLHDIHQIGLYPTYPAEDDKSENDWDPPSSLWENYELRSSLGDPFARMRERLDFDTQRDIDYPPADEVLRQRLLAYAEEVLEKNWKIIRYASDLPSLARVATDPAIASKLRLKAAKISKAHAKNLKKELDKLAKNLKYAFPRSQEEEGTASEREQSGDHTGKSFADMAEQIAIDAQSLAYRVESFIHPKQHTVDLNELRRPGLLDSIEQLENMVSDFQEAPTESVYRQAIPSRQ